jgi:ABC-type glycerol-3-phosphate transport system permease component
MNRVQVRIILLGVAIIALMAVFPHWSAVLHNDGRHQVTPIGYSFIASPPSELENYGSAWGAKIDISRLLIQCVAVVCVTVVLTFARQIVGGKWGPTNKADAGAGK